MDKPLYLFLTGGAWIWKTFTTKLIFQILIPLYDAHYSGYHVKPKGLILAYIGKHAYNLGGTTIHSILLVPFNKSTPTQLSNETFNALGKLYQELTSFLWWIFPSGRLFLIFHWWSKWETLNMSTQNTLEMLKLYFLVTSIKHNLYNIP